jgi:hypothetical protein
MPSDDVKRWALAVRVLAVLSTLMLVTIVLEARTLRQARAELQQLRLEREQANTRAMEPWARQSTRETSDALRWLDTFYSDSTEGLGRLGGLCAGGKLNTDAITSHLFDGFVRARAEGKSYDAAVAEMKTSITNTDAYRAVHPDLSPLRGAK